MVVREGAEGGDPRGGVGKEGVDFPTWARAGAGERGRGGRGKVGRRWRIGRCRGGSWHGAVEGHEDPIQLVGVRGEGIDFGGGGVGLEAQLAAAPFGAQFAFLGAQQHGTRKDVGGRGGGDEFEGLVSSLEGAPKIIGRQGRCRC